MHSLSRSAEEKQTAKADIHVGALLNAPLHCVHSGAFANGTTKPLRAPLCRADAYRSRKLSCKASVSLRCALCRRQFLLWPSMLQPNERSAEIALPHSLHDSDGCRGSDCSSSPIMCSRDHASSVVSASRDPATCLKQWDLCWAKVGDWPYW